MLKCSNILLSFFLSIPLKHSLTPPHRVPSPPPYFESSQAEAIKHSTMNATMNATIHGQGEEIDIVTPTKNRMTVWALIQDNYSGGIIAILGVLVWSLNGHANMIDGHAKNFDQRLERFVGHAKNFDQHLERFVGHAKNFDQHLEKFDGHAETFIKTFRNSMAACCGIGISFFAVYVVNVFF